MRHGKAGQESEALESASLADNYLDGVVSLKYSPSSPNALAFRNVATRS